MESNTQPQQTGPRYVQVEEGYLKHLIYIASHDELTGLYNRYGGMEELQRILDNHTPGFVATLDIDGFKNINDTYSHTVGDEVLHAMGRCLLADSKMTAMRYGGDEFIMFCHETATPPYQHSVILQRLMERIDQIRIPALGDKHVEVSIGVIYYKGEQDVLLKDLYRIVDAICYDHKISEKSHIGYGEARS